ncbi:MAG: hypothetical protein ACRCXT_24270 [Paraclostridium sp.]
MDIINEAAKYVRNIKCPLCDFKSKDKQEIYDHIEEVHGDDIPKGMSIPQFFYNLRNGVTHGSCLSCGKPTAWNETTHKYSRYCGNPKCIAAYRAVFAKRMIGKHGKVHLLNNPAVQQKMLAARKISGEYIWSDGTKKTYTGKNELKFLEYCDGLFEFPSTDVLTPCPFTFFYSLDGKNHDEYYTDEEYDALSDEEKTKLEGYLFYIPDAYIPTLNLIVEIKHGGDNPNKHPKIQAVDVVKDRAKEELMRTQTRFNFMKIEDNKFGDFATYIFNRKYYEDASINSPNIIIRENMAYSPIERIKNKSIYVHFIMGLNSLIMAVSDDLVNLHFPTGEKMTVDEYIKYLPLNTTISHTVYQYDTNEYDIDRVFDNIDINKNSYTKMLVELVNSISDIKIACPANDNGAIRVIDYNNDIGKVIDENMNMILESLGELSCGILSIKEGGL